MADGNPLIIGKVNTATSPGAETVLRRNKTSRNTVFVAQNLDRGDGIRGEGGASGTGVAGTSESGTGVYGYAGAASYSAASAPPAIDTGVYGSSDGDFGVGLWGNSNQAGGTGVVATSDGNGVDSYSFSADPNSAAVTGYADSGVGVAGYSDGAAPGVDGASTLDDGVRGISSTADLNHAGVAGYTTTDGAAVKGVDSLGSGLGVGVWGVTDDGIGVAGTAYAAGYAGYFSGKVAIVGNVDLYGKITVGQKNFRIDHPLDPQNRYLLHTCVESSEMKNIYDGVAQLEKGAAWVELPEWFEALNGDFRYQLTAVSGPAARLHVAEEISDGRFKIAGGEDGMKVCWQVTGTRRDRWAAANPVDVEQEKPEAERGRYLEPSLYDEPEEKRVTIGPIAEKLEATATSSARLESMENLRRRIEEKRQNIQGLRQQEYRQPKAGPETT
jgi:hypothetical protein